jgi:uncharacterized protein YukE
MKHADLSANAAKLELALKTFRTTFAGVDPQWTDAARQDFQKTYLEPMAPKVKNIVQAITRLAGVLASAERQCSSESR